MKRLVSAQPSFVFHLAVQALVQCSYEDPLGIWQTNVLGTLHVLEALQDLDKSCVAVVITSNKSLHYLQWHAVMDFEGAVRMTIERYRAYYQNPAQIAAYTVVAKQRSLAWAQ
jgi:UDP-glucose 4-epimerase